MIKKKTAAQANRFRIGGNIRKWRNIKEIKQKELANSMNLSEAAVSNIENDITNITVTQLEEISIALNVSIEQLLSDPQERFHNADTVTGTERKQNNYPDHEFLRAIIASMEKKDQQLQTIMQHFIHAVDTLLQQERFVFNPGKQVASRA